MGKLSRRKKDGSTAFVVNEEEQATKGYRPVTTFPQLEEREIEAARKRHEKSTEEKRKRRAELRATQNRPWKTELPKVIDLRHGPADMATITRQFNDDVRKIREEDKRSADEKKRAS